VRLVHMRREESTAKALGALSLSTAAKKAPRRRETGAGRDFARGEVSTTVDELKKSGVRG
jgi:hypothetical protein